MKVSIDVPSPRNIYKVGRGEVALVMDLEGLDFILDNLPPNDGATVDLHEFRDTLPDTYEYVSQRVLMAEMGYMLMTQTPKEIAAQMFPPPEEENGK